MSIVPQAPGNPGGLPLPQQGVFATSEILPMLAQATRRLSQLSEDWKAARENANRLEALAKKVRADTMIELRVFGSERTGSIPIKTAAERNEWADADERVQQARLEADLAQTVQMHAREVYHDAQGYYSTLQQLASVERDEWKREHGAQTGGTL